jgi:hypothetical protein
MIYDGFHLKSAWRHHQSTRHFLFTATVCWRRDGRQPIDYLGRTAQTLMPNLQRHASRVCHTAIGHRGAFGTSPTTARHNSKWRAVERTRQIKRFRAVTPHSAPNRELAACALGAGKLPQFCDFRGVVARCGTAVVGSPDMSELTPHWARNHKGVGVAPSINPFAVRLSNNLSAERQHADQTQMSQPDLCPELECSG